MYLPHGGHYVHDAHDHPNHRGSHNGFRLFFFLCRSMMASVDGCDFPEYPLRDDVEKLEATKVFAEPEVGVRDMVVAPCAGHDQSKTVECDHPGIQASGPICNTCGLHCK